VTQRLPTRGEKQKGQLSDLSIGPKLRLRKRKWKPSNPEDSSPYPYVKEKPGEFKASDKLINSPYKDEGQHLRNWSRKRGIRMVFSEKGKMKINPTDGEPYVKKSGELNTKKRGANKTGGTGGGTWEEVTFILAPRGLGRETKKKGKRGTREIERVPSA